MVHYVVRGPRHWGPGEWRARRQGVIPADGKPSEENLKRHVEHYEQSTREGGPNAHLGKTVILSARIVDQQTGMVVAEYKRPEPPEYGLGYMQGRGAS